MIVTYDRSKIYNPQDENHRIRRAVKLEVERFYTPNKWNSLAVQTLLRVPGLRKCVNMLVNLGQKFLVMDTNNKEALWLCPSQSQLEQVPMLAQSKQTLTI